MAWTEEELKRREEALKGIQERALENGLMVKLSESGEHLVWTDATGKSTEVIRSSTEMVDRKQRIRKRRK